MVADVTLRYLTMAESRTGERSSQPEFEAFYLRTSRLLHGYLCRLSRDPATADEVLQEAYVRLINAPDVEEQVRKAYLYRTATNLLRDRWRKQKRERKYWQTENFSEAVSQNLDMPLDVSSVFGLTGAVILLLLVAGNCGQMQDAMDHRSWFLLPLLLLTLTASLASGAILLWSPAKR